MSAPTGPLPSRWRSGDEASAHAAAIAGVLDTPPILPRYDGVVVFSMIGTAQVLPFLVAVKSLWAHLGRGRVVVLDDGTLAAQDRAILAHHCGDPEMLHVSQVDRGPFPKGAGWERLLSILDRRQSEYWIQLGPETLTLGPIPEIADALARNRSFLLLEGDDVPDEPLPAEEFARKLYPEGPQADDTRERIEARLAKISGESGWRYARGSAGLAGFSALGSGRPLTGAFLAEIRKLIREDDIKSLDCEEVFANFHIANEPAAVLLPYARYLNYRGTALPQGAAFARFPEPDRHREGTYTEASRAVIETLGRSGDAAGLDKTGR